MSETMYQQVDKAETLLERIGCMNEILEKLIGIHDLQELAEFEKRNSITGIMSEYENILNECARFKRTTLATLHMFTASYLLLGGLIVFLEANIDKLGHEVYIIQFFLSLVILLTFTVQSVANLGEDISELNEKMKDSHLVEVEGIADFIIIFHRAIGAVEWQKDKEDIFRLIEQLRRVESLLNKDFIKIVTSELKKRIFNRKISISDFYLELFLILRPYSELSSHYNIKLSESYNDLMNFITSNLDGNHHEPIVDTEHNLLDNNQVLVIHPEAEEG